VHLVQETQIVEQKCNDADKSPILLHAKSVSLDELASDVCCPSAMVLPEKRKSDAHADTGESQRRPGSTVGRWNVPVIMGI
jgi:hypothetical protein